MLKALKGINVNLSKRQVHVQNHGDDLKHKMTSHDPAGFDKTSKPLPHEQFIWDVAERLQHEG